MPFASISVLGVLGVVLMVEVRLRFRDLRFLNCW